MNAPFLTVEPGLVTRALDELRASAGIEGELLPEAGPQADAAIVLDVHGRKLRYDCTVKRKVDRYGLISELISTPRSSAQHLLVSAQLSHDMATRCREMGQQFIDTAGNAYISDRDGIYVFVSGRRAPESLQRDAHSATTTPAALKMMFAVLAEPSLLNAPYREISHRSIVSTGAIGKVFETLEARRLIAELPSGKRMIRSPEMFLNEWASGYVSRLKPKLKKYRFNCEDLDKFRHWSPGFRLSAWGGEMGAAHLTKHLRAEHYTVYVDMDDPHALRDLVRQFHLRADPNGEIEVVQMFWNTNYFTEWFPTVPPHLIYADLLASHDSRNLAVAKRIVCQVVEHVHDKSR